MLTDRAGKPRRPRKIGGRESSFNERAPAIAKMIASPGVIEKWTWKSQCFCGSIEAKHYRRAWWCPRCGWEKDPARRPTIGQ